MSHTELEQLGWNNLLERKSLFKRRTPGTDRSEQLIAAKVDTLFIVSFCNQDFNEARTKRYLALAHESGVMPVVVLTRADLSDDVPRYVDATARLAPGLPVEAVNALDRSSLECIDPRLGAGRLYKSIIDGSHHKKGRR